jgi:FtsP/CotA-like multicopper oxidase with cupredoxin domain
MKVIDMKQIQRSSFKLNPVAAAIVLAMASQFSANVAQANAGFGVDIDISGAKVNIPTYFAASPSGVHPAFDPATHAYSVAGVTVDTGMPLRKFIDPLGGALNYNGLDGTGIPVAITEKWKNPLTGAQTTDDYYEIAVVEYTQQMHTDLPKQTRLRGYVQIETPAIAANGANCQNHNGANTACTDITGIIGSEHIPAMYPDGVTPIRDLAGNQVFFVHHPHYLAPVILAAKGTPVRIKYTNYLPYNDVNGNSVGSWNGQGGELYLPVDETIAGGGPTFDALGKPIVDALGKPVKFSQNRAAIHWHGGDAPWISDGTPHQWFAPAGDASYSMVDAMHPKGMGKGDSAANVPDMPDPGPGSYTLYFPNNLSGRLMMYHDHVSGLTKLNAYAGMAAGYVVYDPTELTLAAKALGTTLAATPTTGPFAGTTLPSGLLDSVGIPLVIQDKTFVPKNIGPSAVASDGVTPASQDAKWNLTHWGQPGDLYFPHVYETNQNPNSADGTNAVGRWDWGPWFWPVFPAQYSLPTGDYGDATATPEAFGDTAVVNGQAYPTLTVDPKAYRFRILSIGNDRTFNLGLYEAVDANRQICDSIVNPAPAMAPAAAGGLAPAACTEVKMVPALQTPGFPATWPNDGRVGGVPDPATAGPDIVQIGSEGGLLPVPAIWKSQPISYETNVRSINMFNLLHHDLLLGGGERADVFIDFSKYAGKTLILYNDAPTPMPAMDPRTDFYTGMGDNTPVGGAYDVLPGYGPNTRTVMQFKVNATNTSGSGGPLNIAALQAALPAAYAATQPAPIIPESVYNAAFGTSDVDNYAHMYTGTFTQPLFTYTVAPYVDAAGVTQTTKSLPVINKAIQELFDPVYGRMNSTLAAEMPFSSATVATTIPLAYIDTPVERLDAIKDGEVQIWKVTHNGVDGHPVHFHMVNVQVINRVGWDGVVKPPHANEVGWKETLVMNPLEDVYVAVKAVHPVTPFGLPTSSRLLDPSQAVNGHAGFTNIDPTTGGAPAFQTQLVNGIMTNVPTQRGQYSNQLTFFDNEYVWHCHILGHEENDFMRPFIFHPNVTVPDAPAAVTLAGNTLTWKDTTPFGGQDAQGMPTAGTNAAYPTPTSSTKNEIGFKIKQVSLNAAGNPIIDAAGNVVTTPILVGGVEATVPANVQTWTDPAPVAGRVYAVVAYNAAGDSVPGTALTTTTAGALAGVAAVVAPVSYAATPVAAAVGPTGLSASLNADGSATLTWITVPGATRYFVTVNGGVAVPVAVPAIGAPTYIVPKANLRAGINTFSVAAETLAGTTDIASTTLNNVGAVSPVAFVASTTAVPGTITLNWANSPQNVNNVTGLTLSWTHLGVTRSKSFAPTVTGASIINLQSGTAYNFTLLANSNLRNSTPVATVPAGTVAP